MAEELRSALAALGGLKVVARTSSEMLRNVDAVSAARRLDVANIITGSVRRSPTTVRVSAQLVDGKSGLEQWSRTFDRPFGDVLAIQSDIASNVARALSIELDSSTRAVLSNRGTNNPEAQDLLLRATTAQRDDSESGLLATIALLDQAIELDPNYAEAHGKKAFILEILASTYATSVKAKERRQSQAIECSAARDCDRSAIACRLCRSRSCSPGPARVEAVTGGFQASGRASGSRCFCAAQLCAGAKPDAAAG